MFTPIEFTVIGKPATAGSKRAFPLMKGGKFVRSIIVDSSGAAGKSWRTLVQDRATEAFGYKPLLEGPLNVDMMFMVARPKGHSGKNGLKPSAPAFPTVRPDLLKWARAVEDALTGIVWKDDSQIVTERLYKRYREQAGVIVHISDPVL